MMEADGVVAGVVRDAEIKDADTVVETLEDGLFLAAEEVRVRETTTSISLAINGVGDAGAYGPV